MVFPRLRGRIGGKSEFYLGFMGQRARGTGENGFEMFEGRLIGHCLA